MYRQLFALVTALIVAFAITKTMPMPMAAAQDAAKAKKAAAVRAAPGMKTCTYKFPDGEKRTWTCRKEEPCCAWDAIKYVKCGSTITNCL